MNGQIVWLEWGLLVAALVLGMISMIVPDRRLAYQRMSGMQRIVTRLCIVVIVWLAVAAYGWGIGLLVAGTIVVIGLTVHHLRWAQQAAQRLYSRGEATIMKHTRSWDWLEWFASPEHDEATMISSHTELLDIASRSRVLSPRELRQFEALLGANHIRVRDIMVPVDRIVSVSVEESLGPLVLDDLHRSGYRQFPVIRGDIDHVVGVLYLDDIVDLRSAKSSVKTALDPRVDYLSPHDHVRDALKQCLESRRMLMIVQDDDKKTLGLVTLRDIVASLLGS
jgi:CBS domain containing-hemolysin-like protein